MHLDLLKLYHHPDDLPEVLRMPAEETDAEAVEFFDEHPEIEESSTVEGNKHAE